MNQSETAILCLSDPHFGKITSSYNSNVFFARMGRLVTKLASIRALLSDYTFDSLVICSLGDLNDGSGIYPTQPNYQEKPDPRQQAKELSAFLAKWLLKLKETWGNVRFEGVPGNHGFSGRATALAANWDLMTYDLLKAELKDQIEIGYNDYGQGDPFIRVIEVRKHKYLLYHAHEIRMYQNVPFYGILGRLQRWYSSSLGPFDAALLGHFHTQGKWKINDIHAICAGTPVTSDEWSLRVLGMEAANTWPFFGVSNKYPVTWSFDLALAEP